MPTVSIIIPVYNSQHILAHCLDSVLAQTFKDFEVLCINDGSTDGSYKILEEYANKDSRIRVIEQVNQGISSARNKGLDEACGEYILLIDNDDVINPQTLEILTYFAEREQSDIVHFNHVKTYEEFFQPPSDVIDYKSMAYKVFDDFLLTQLNRELHFSTFIWDKLLRRSSIQGVRFPDGFLAEDTHFLWTFLTRRPKAVYIDVTLYYYNIYNEKSVSNSCHKPNKIMGVNRAILNIIDAFEKAGLHQELKRALRTQLFYIYRYQLALIKQTKEPKAKAALVQAMTAELQDFQAKGILAPDYFFWLERCPSWNVVEHIKYNIKHILRNTAAYISCKRLLSKASS